MTHVADDAVLGKLARQQNDLFRRVREGTVDPVLTGQILQWWMEGKLPNLPDVVAGRYEMKPINHVINFGAPCKRPLSGATLASYGYVHKRVPLEFRADGLYLDFKPLMLFRSEKQRGEERISGHDLYKELVARGGNVGAKVLDHLVAHPELWPESWKPIPHTITPAMYFWGDVFNSPLDGSLVVRYGSWQEGRVESDYRHLDYNWDLNDFAVSF